MAASSAGAGSAGGWTQAAWVVILIVLLGSAALLLGVILGVVRSCPLDPGRKPIPPQLGQQPRQDQGQTVDRAKAKVDQAGLL